MNRNMTLFAIYLIVLFPIYQVSALTISSQKLDSTATSITVSWHSDEMTSGVVYYGLSDELGSSASDAATATDHTVTIMDLIPSTQYYVKIKGDTTTNTLNTKDADVPSSNPLELLAGTITTTSIELTWGADGSSQYDVYMNNQKVQRVSQTSYVAMGLTPGTMYSFYIVGVDADGNQGDSSHPLTISTKAPDVTKPIISNLDVSRDANGVTITWNTDENADSKIEYGKSTLTELEEFQYAYTDNHSITIGGLEDHVRYYFRATSCDEAGNCAYSSLKDVIAGMDTTPPVVSAQFPDYINSQYVTITGSTEPFSIVRLYVGNSLKASITDTGESGSFSFNNAYIGSGSGTMKMKIEAEDDWGNKGFVEKDVRIDTVPPKLVVEDLPSITGNTTLSIKGSVDELATLEFFVYKVDSADDVSPPRVQGISVDSANGSVSLSWEDLNIADLNYYVVYRDDIGAIATTTTPSYTDTSVGNKVYRYQIAAVDTACNLGSKSVAATVTAKGIAPKNISATDVSCSGINAQHSVDQIGMFNEEVRLEDGKNMVKIVATDIAGNSVEYMRMVEADTVPIEIVETNMDKLSPTYIREVTIKGRVNKNATVIILVNNKTSGRWGTSLFDVVSGLVDKDSEYITTTDDTGYFSLDVKLTKEFRLDANSTSTIAGLSDVWSNNITIVALDRAGHIDTVTGIIQYALCGQGNDWQIHVSDIYPAELIPRYIVEGFAETGFTVNLTWQGYAQEPKIDALRITLPPLSEDMKDFYDAGWMPKSPTIVTSYDKKYGYATMRFKYDPSPYGTNWTMNQKEDNISNHHKGECGVPDVGLKYPKIGCIMIPLMIEVDYACDSDVDGKADEVCTQKQCIDFMVMIDPRLPITDNIPRDFLESSVEFLNSTIAGINMLLCGNDKGDPCDGGLMAITKIVMVSCGAMWVLSFFKAISEWSSCWNVDLNNFRTSSNGAGGVTCTLKSGASGDTSNCEMCMQAKYSTLQWLRYMNLVCDRIFCPAVPSLEYYIEQKYGGKFQNADPKNPVSNCPGTYDSSAKDAYNKDDPGLEQCKYNLIFPYAKPDPKCCEEEYMWNWDYGALMLDENKESKCLYMKKAGLEDSEEYKQDCGGWRDIYRYVADFSLCDNGDGEDEFKAYSMGNQRYFLVYNNKDGKVAYSATRFEESSPNKKTNANSDVVQVGDTNVFYRKVDNILDMSSTSCKMCKEDQGKNINFCKACTCYICQNKGENSAYKDKCQYKNVNTGKIEPIPEQIIASTCSITPNKKYVIDPTSGIMRSIQSVCLSSLVGYLKHYRQVLSLIRGCFQTILYTGDGSAGMCRSVLTMYVCDIIYYAISCVKEYSTAGFGGRMEGLTGFFKHVGGSFNTIQSAVTNRYGSSNLYKVMFVEKKLIHAICLGAFTGDWDIDLEGFLTEATDVPIDSTAAIAPAQRRFISYDGISGRATFVYHMGVLLIAGADVEYSLELICSNNNECDPSENFKNGYCDCAQGGNGEKIVTITNDMGTGKLFNGEVINKEIFVMLRSANDASKVRYNKVRLRYKYTNNYGETVEKEIVEPIKQIGGNPPLSCEFDVPTLMYRCQFYIGNRGQGNFEDTLTPAYPGKESKFRIGDTVSLDPFSVTIDVPQNSASKFFLIYNISKSDGTGIGSEGTDMKTISSSKTIENFPKFRLTQAMFRHGRLGTGEHHLNPEDYCRDYEQWTMTVSLYYPKMDDNGNVLNEPSKEIADTQTLSIGVSCEKSDASETDDGACKNEGKCNSAARCQVRKCGDKDYYCAYSSANGLGETWAWRLGADPTGAKCDKTNDYVCDKDKNCKKNTATSSSYEVKKVWIYATPKDSSKVERTSLPKEDICILRRNNKFEVEISIVDDKDKPYTDMSQISLNLYTDNGKKLTEQCKKQGQTLISCMADTSKFPSQDGDYGLEINGKVGKNEISKEVGNVKVTSEDKCN